MVDGCLGEIRFFGGDFAPLDWAFCEGQLLPIGSYTNLFNVIGATYGGDGTTTFALPDLRGRAAVQQGFGPGLPPVALGEQFGNAQILLTPSNLPSHTHPFSVTATSEVGDSTSPEGAVLANSGTFDNEFKGTPTAGTSVEMAADTTGPTGSNQPLENRPPSLGRNL